MCSLQCDIFTTCAGCTCCCCAYQVQQLQHALAHLQHVTNQEGAGEADGGGSAACTAAAPPPTSALLPFAIACRDEVRGALLRLRAAGGGEPSVAGAEATSTGHLDGDANGTRVGGGGTQQTRVVNSHLSAVLTALDTLAAAVASAELAGEDAAVPRLDLPTPYSARSTDQLLLAARCVPPTTYYVGARRVPRVRHGAARGCRAARRGA